MVRARGGVVLLDVPRARARSLRDRPSAGPSATISTSRSARATLRTVYRSASALALALARTRVPPGPGIRLLRIFGSCSAVQNALLRIGDILDCLVSPVSRCQA